MLGYVKRVLAEGGGERKMRREGGRKNERSRKNERRGKKGEERKEDNKERG